MATHYSVLAGRLPGTGEPGGLPSMGSHRVGHDLSDSAAAEDELRQCLQTAQPADWHRGSLQQRVIRIIPNPPRPRLSKDSPEVWGGKLSRPAGQSSFLTPLTISSLARGWRK